MGALDKLIKNSPSKSKTSSLDALLTKKQVTPALPVKTQLNIAGNLPTAPFADLRGPLPASQKVNYGALANIKNIPQSEGGGQAWTDEKYFQTEAKGTKSYGTLPAKTGTQRDHLIPAALGGTSFDPNLKYTDLEQAKATDVIEQANIDAYKKGEISLDEARANVVKAKEIPEDYITESLNQAKQFIKNPIQGFKDAFQAALDADQQALTEQTKSGTELVRQFQAGPEKSTTAERLATEVNYGVSTVNTLFALTGITPAFAAAEKIPVLKQAADLISLPFALTGQFGSFATNKFVDSLPISEEDKKVIRPSFDQAGSLIAQVLLGGKILEGISKGRVKLTDDIKTWVKESKEQAPQAAEAMAKKVESGELTAPKATVKPQDAITEAKPIETAKVSTEPAKTEIKAEELKTRKKQLLTEREQYFEEFKNTEEAFKIAQEAEMTNEQALNAKFDSSVVSGIKKNYNFRKEGTLHDQMGRGWLMKNNKGEYVVTTPEQTKRFEKNGWEKDIEIDSLAHEAGFENGNDYLEYQLEMSRKQGTIQDIDVELDKHLKATDPVYKALSEEIEKVKNDIKTYEETQSPKAVARALAEEERVLTEKQKQLYPETTAGEGKTPSKIAKSIQAKAIEEGLTQGFSEIAGYDKIKIKDQAERAANLINEDFETARKIIRGEEELPQGLKGTALITAMEDYIKKNPDSDLAYELANSHLVSGTSEAAQELRLAAERTPDSATARLQEIKKAREAQVKEIETKRTKIKRELKEEVKKTNLKGDDLKWENFLESIKC